MERSEIGPGVFPWQSSYVLTIHITGITRVFYICMEIPPFRRIGIYDVPRCVRGAGVDFPFGGVRGSSDFPEFISTARPGLSALDRAYDDATTRPAGRPTTSERSRFSLACIELRTRCS